ncbi:MAG TPA: Hint domain-containing protein [Candidatus Limnocylindria bacterium]|nr:Hint domain-containing protein [Candidatus Limnocylindria bacterium]
MRLPHGVPLVASLALVVAACGDVGTSPTASPAFLTQADLKYRVIGELGPPWFCDPDFYPIARADERDVAVQRFSEIQQDPATFDAIRARLKLGGPAYTVDEQLAIYREWKTLNALPLQRLGDVWGFAYLAQKGAGGERVDGRVSTQGRVTVLSRTPAGAPPCPICLAVGTRIATPRGEIPVEELRIGDDVWTQDARGDRMTARIVAAGRSPVPASHEVVRLVLADGRAVVASPGHPTADGRLVDGLRPGDMLDGARVVTAVRARYEGRATYDILPASPRGTYWANGVLLGSTLGTR